MNCQNCGGLTAPDATGTVLRCRFCESVQFLGDGEGPDGLVLIGPESELVCPRGCGQLAGGHVDGQAVAGCATCRGVVASAMAFGMIVTNRRKRWNGPEPIPTPIDPESLHRAATCPGCGYRMETHPYYGPGNCVIDSCGRCKLVWIDAGEIAAIERAPGRR